MKDKKIRKILLTALLLAAMSVFGAVSVFAEDAGYDEEACKKAATYFRGGMQMGSVCGAVTGSLMAIGLAGVDDPQIPGELFRRVRENHEGMLNCKDLLRINAERGGEKMSHCNAMIRECIGYTEEILREKGKLSRGGSR